MSIRKDKDPDVIYGGDTYKSRRKSNVYEGEEGRKRLLRENKPKPGEYDPETSYKIHDENFGHLPKAERKPDAYYHAQFELARTDKSMNKIEKAWSSRTRGNSSPTRGAAGRHFAKEAAEEQKQEDVKHKVGRRSVFEDPKEVVTAGSKHVLLRPYSTKSMVDQLLEKSMTFDLAKKYADFDDEGGSKPSRFAVNRAMKQERKWEMGEDKKSDKEPPPRVKSALEDPNIAKEKRTKAFFDRTGIPTVKNASLRSDIDNLLEKAVIGGPSKTLDQRKMLAQTPAAYRAPKEGEVDIESEREKNPLINRKINPSALAALQRKSSDQSCVDHLEKSMGRAINATVSGMTSEDKDKREKAFRISQKARKRYGEESFNEGLVGEVWKRNKESMKSKGSAFTTKGTRLFAGEFISKSIEDEDLNLKKEGKTGYMKYLKDPETGEEKEYDLGENTLREEIKIQQEEE